MKNTLIFLLLFGLGSCIDPFNFKYDGQVSHLVVEGIFTNLAGPHSVKLSLSQPLATGYRVFVNDAVVTIKSVEGEIYPLNFSKSGVYWTTFNVQGVHGHTYYVEINWKGKLYRSKPAKMYGTPPAIDGVSYRYETLPFVTLGDKEAKMAVGYAVYVDFKDNEDDQNFYRWAYNVTYEVYTQPEDYIDHNCRSCPRPAPKPCCSHCWVTEREEGIRPVSDRLFNGKQVGNQFAAFLPFYRYMNVKCKIKLNQYAITEEAYEFYKALQQQSANTGTMFDPPPTELKGNLYNLNDEFDQVIGFFDVASVSSYESTIVADALPYLVPKFIYADDCLVLHGATVVRPDNW